MVADNLVDINVIKTDVLLFGAEDSGEGEPEGMIG